MAAGESGYLQYLLDCLGALGDVRARRMFSGYGLYCDGQFFAIFARDVLYFKVSEEIRAAYQARGSEPFAIIARGRLRALTSYWRVPDDVLEDAELLIYFAARACASARAARTASPKKRRARTATKNKAVQKSGGKKHSRR